MDFLPSSSVIARSILQCACAVLVAESNPVSVGFPVGPGSQQRPPGRPTQENKEKGGADRNQGVPGRM